MSKTTAPLLSFDARGSIAKTQVYSSWRGVAYARRYVVPANPDTAAQQATRTVFSYLNNVWKFGQADFVAAFDAAASGRPLTGRNLLVQQVLPNMRGETDILTMVFSPGARAGVVAGGMSLAAGANQITATLTAPTLPAGWTITKAIACALPNANPTTTDLYIMSGATDATDPYAPVITGLTSAQEYVVGGFFEFLRPDGAVAYGRSLIDTETPS